MKSIFAFSLLVAIGLGIVYLNTRPNEYDYARCMNTFTDKTVCVSMNPNK